MKNLLSLLFAIPFMAFAQSPQGINYQAVAYDANGFELSNKEVGVRISIIEGDVFGASNLVEVHTVTTSNQGLFSLLIGLGEKVGGSAETLLDIPWGSNTYFLKIELDTENNGSYMDFGTQQFMSVPYALYAESTGDKNDADFDPENELQLLSINEDTIFLTEGGYINLPETFSGHYDSLTGTPQNISQFINDAGYVTQENQFGGSMPSWVFNTGMCSDNIPEIFKSSNDTISNGNISFNGDHSFCNFTLNQNDTLSINGEYLILRVSDTLTINGHIDGVGQVGVETVYGGVTGGRGGNASGLQQVGGNGYTYYVYSLSTYSEIADILVSTNGSEVSPSYYYSPLILNNSKLYGSRGSSGTRVDYTSSTNYGNSGGNGGAGLIIICKHLILDGSINLSGENGSNATGIGGWNQGYVNGAGGGGGSGSLLINTANLISNTSVIELNGGLGGDSFTDGGLNGSSGQNGGNGFIIFLND
jgi:hypothetical protein